MRCARALSDLPPPHAGGRPKTLERLSTEIGKSQKRKDGFRFCSWERRPSLEEIRCANVDFERMECPKCGEKDPFGS